VRKVVSDCGSWKCCGMNEFIVLLSVVKEQQI